MAKLKKSYRKPKKPGDRRVRFGNEIVPLKSLLPKKKGNTHPSNGRIRD